MILTCFSRKDIENTNLFMPSRLRPEVGSYIGDIGVLLLGEKAYECTKDIRELRRPVSLDAAAANIIQSTKLL